jgi:hypothetical protein
VEGLRERVEEGIAGNDLGRGKWRDSDDFAAILRVASQTLN